MPPNYSKNDFESVKSELVWKLENWNGGRLDRLQVGVMVVMVMMMVMIMRMMVMVVRSKVVATMMTIILSIIMRMGSRCG